MDTNSLAKLQLLHPKLRDRAIDAYNEACKVTPANVHPYIVQTFRSIEESNAIYELGRTKVNPDGKSGSKPMGDIVSDARGGSSYHNFGLALDFGLLINGKVSYVIDNNWMVVVNVFKKHGFTWGGDFQGSFKDNPHLEDKMGHNWRDLLVKYNNKEFIPGTEYLNI